MNPLKDKLDKVKDEHAEAELVQMQSNHDEKSAADAHFLLGRIKQNEHIAVAISTNLTAQTVRALERFQQDKRYEALGYENFVDFLDKSEYAPMTKRQYYDRLALIREHGDEIYDLMTAVGISVRSQKMLGSGDVSIKNDTLYIGDKEVGLADTGIIKDVLNELFQEKRELERTVSKHHDVIDKLTEQIQTGTDEYEELRRNYDKLRTGDPYDEALAHAVYSLLELQEQVGHLADDQKADKGKIAVETLWSVMLKLRESYGVNIALTEPMAAAAAAAGSENPRSAIRDPQSAVAAVLAGDDDFGDEQEGN